MVDAEMIDRAVASVDFGRPTAAKRGRNAAYPYVPVVDLSRPEGGGVRTQTRQILGRAFATRDEAVACAAAQIERARVALAADLAMPNKRALREHHGLPREIR